MHQRYSIGSWFRWSCGGILLLAAVTLLLTARTVDWGVAWTMVVPALVAFFPALGLMQHRVLELRDDVLHIHEGRLWRREWQLRLQGAIALEIIPMAGLHALVLHRGGHEYPLATWISRRRAEAAAIWLDQAAPNGSWPRRTRARPQLDR